MIDNENQRIDHNDRPVDNVSGYTIQQLEHCLVAGNRIRTMEQWCDAIYLRYPNPTKNYLHELFNNY